MLSTALNSNVATLTTSVNAHIVTALSTSVYAHIVRALHFHILNPPQAIKTLGKWVALIIEISFAYGSECGSETIVHQILAVNLPTKNVCLHFNTR